MTDSQYQIGFVQIGIGSVLSQHTLHVPPNQREYYEVYDRVQKQARGASLSLKLLTSLETGAADYAALLNPDHEKWNDYPLSTRRAIQTLCLLRLPKPMRPLMLSVVRAMTPQEADRAFRMLVSLSVRYLIVGGMRSGSVEETLAAAAHNTSEGKITTSKELVAFLGKVVPPDARFRKEFEVASVSAAHLVLRFISSATYSVRRRASGSPLATPACASGHGGHLS